MRYIRASIALTLIIAAAGCSWRRTPVPILDESGSTALLVGSWSGEYSSRETGRRGSISFDLESEKDTAYCDIVMTPKVQNVRVAAGQAPEFPVVTVPAPATPLKIRFIRLGENRVSGTLDPYTDPDCGCTVNTTFEGTFQGPGVIEGTYVTRGAGHDAATGKWKVTRRKITQSGQ
jgi:hypothetical protein